MSPMTKIIEATGMLDGAKGSQLRETIVNAISEGSKTILVDLKNVTFIDSSGLGALVAALKVSRTASVDLYLCSITDQVQMLFELTSMDQIFQILPSQNEFLATVGA